MTVDSLTFQQGVQTGVWTDFETNRWRLLWEEHAASRLTTALGVVLTLSGPYLFIIGLFTIINVARVLKRVNRAVKPTAQDPEQQSLLPRQHGLSTMEFLEQSKDIGGSRGYVQNLKKASRNTGGCQTILLGLVAVVLMMLWIGRVIAGILAAEVLTDGTALWSSQRCGVWEFDSDNSGDSAATRHDLLDREKESRAGDYARSCYDTPHVLQSMSCYFFYEPDINFTSSYSYMCPFEDPALCVKGAPAVTFDTGLVEASRLGINAPAKDTYKFRRSSTCVPLSIDSPYVESRDKNGTMAFDYYYGQISDGDYSRESTFSSTGSPFDVRIPAYDVEVYTWDPDSSSNYWIPRPNLRLKTTEKYSLTIMFISSLRLLFVEPSNDPVFPTDKTYGVDDDPSPWYYKSDPRYRVLVCSDSQQMCSSDSQQCWSRTNRVPELPPAYWLMDLSLQASNTYDSIAKRLGSALIAQEKVSQFMSAALPKDHWVAEARRLFASSLARIQFDAWSIASGEDAVHVGADGYIDKTPEQAGDLCGLFKFRSTGYRNIDLLAFLLTILLVPLPSWVLSRRVRTKVLNPKQSDNDVGQRSEDSRRDDNSQPAHRDYGTMGAPPASDIDESTAEISAAGPSSSEENISPESKGKGIVSVCGGDQNHAGDSSSASSDLVAVFQAVSDDGRLTAENEDGDKTFNAQKHVRMKEDESDDNIVLFWAIGTVWSIMCLGASRMKSKYRRPTVSDARSLSGL